MGNVDLWTLGLSEMIKYMRNSQNGLFSFAAESWKLNQPVETGWRCGATKEIQHLFQKQHIKIAIWHLQKIILR